MPRFTQNGEVKAEVTRVMGKLFASLLYLSCQTVILLWEHLPVSCVS